MKTKAQQSGGSADTQKLLVVAMCTAHRPEMLKRSLATLLAQELPRGWQLAIAVVENDRSAKCEHIVSELAGSSEVPVYYALEKEQGIPIARNTCVELALSKDPDWIVFFDDDEMAPPEWLAAYCDATEKYEAEIFRGPVTFEFPEDYPNWMGKGHRTVKETGSKAPFVTTSNAMVRADVFGTSEDKLRFDEKMRYTGCSDIDFFKRAKKRGFTALDVREAHIFEEIPPVRSTLRWQLRLQMQLHATRVYIERKHKPLPLVLLNEIGLFFKLVFRGSIGVFLFPICFLAYQFTAKRLGYMGLSDLARATGVLCGILGIKVNPYKQIDGY